MGDSWEDVQARIGTVARVCAYDRLGVGDSGRPPRSQTFEDMAATLDVVVAKLDLQLPLVLVAHGLGGMVAATWAAEHPDDVRGLLMVDATGPGYPRHALDLLPRSGGSAAAELRDDVEALLDPSENVEHLDGRVAFADVENLPPLGDVAMTVLTRSIVDVGADVRPRQAANLESAWEEGQNQWLGLSSQARLERVDLAGHQIQHDQPQVVVARARELVGR
jgi:pimeloyl-ACP methyl ester carboxylesterase